MRSREHRSSGPPCLTVSLQALRAARADPVDFLRYEYQKRGQAPFLLLFGFEGPFRTALAEGS
jgi:hypothetical protein